MGVAFRFSVKYPVEGVKDDILPSIPTLCFDWVKRDIKYEVKDVVSLNNQGEIHITQRQLVNMGEHFQLMCPVELVIKYFKDFFIIKQSRVTDGHTWLIYRLYLISNCNVFVLLHASKLLNKW